MDRIRRFTAFGFNCIWRQYFYLYKQKFLNKTQKDFVNNFTHEFKTPLAVIKIAAEVLQHPDISQKPEKLKNYAAIIDEQITHLQSQTQRLLEIAYTDSNALQLTKEKFDVNNLLQQAINNLHPLAEEKNAVIQTTFSSAGIMVTADKYYMLLTFINLIENAIKYSSNPKINISTYTEGHDC